ncbi:isochorismatase hydrolase [Sarocladium strictum]
MSRKALFCIDIQYALALDTDTRVPHAERLLAASAKVLEAARAIIDQHASQGKPSPILIFVVQHEEPEGGELVRGTKAWELAFEPRDVADEVLVAKTHGNTFESNPDLVGELRAKGVDEIFTFGIQSDCCVTKTTLGALEAGFPVTVLSGAHTTYDEGSKTASEIEEVVNSNLAAKGAKIVGWEEVIATWEKDFVI